MIFQQYGALACLFSSEMPSGHRPSAFSLPCCRKCAGIAGPLPEKPRPALPALGWHFRNSFRLLLALRAGLRPFSFGKQRRRSLALLGMLAALRMPRRPTLFYRHCLVAGCAASTSSSAARLVFSPYRGQAGTDTSLRSFGAGLRLALLARSRISGAALVDAVARSPSRAPPASLACRPAFLPSPPGFAWSFAPEKPPCSRFAAGGFSGSLPQASPLPELFCFIIELFVSSFCIFKLITRDNLNPRAILLYIFKLFVNICFKLMLILLHQIKFNSFVLLTIASPAGSLRLPAFGRLAC